MKNKQIILTLLLVASSLLIIKNVSAASPIGYHDTVNNTACSTRGWVYDPDTVSSSLYVDIYRDGGAGSGVNLGRFIANVYRSDVNSSRNISGSHGFDITLPSSMKDGVSHSLYAYAIDSSGQGPNPLLNNSPKTIQCSAPTPRAADIQAQINALTIKLQALQAQLKAQEVGKPTNNTQTPTPTFSPNTTQVPTPAATPPIKQAPSSSTPQKEESVNFPALARTFPLFSHFVKEKDAVLFSIALGSLPDRFTSWDVNILKQFIIVYFGDWIQNPENLDYKIEIEGVLYSPPFYQPSIDELCRTDTILHEYAHVLDKQVGRIPELRRIDTQSFYSISFDMENPYSDSYGTYYSARRPDNIYNEFVSSYAIYGGARTPLRNDKFAPWEDFAESFSMYVTQGTVFKELAKTDPFMKQKYDFLKQVFQGKEYSSGDIRGISAVRSIIPPSNEMLPAQHSCDYSWRIPGYIWNYKF